MVASPILAKEYSGWPLILILRGGKSCPIGKMEMRKPPELLTREKTKCPRRKNGEKDFPLLSKKGPHRERVVDKKRKRGGIGTKSRLLQHRNVLR